MATSSKAIEILKRISGKDTKLGDLRKIAKTIKRDHDLAMELWSTGAFNPRQLAILIMDKRQLTQEVIDQLDRDMHSHDSETHNQLADWLMANQLTKDKKTIALMLSWERHPSPTLRRIFWYYQARLRWTGNTAHENTVDLITKIEKGIGNEVPEVQWAMNFTAGQIGTYEEKHRLRCMKIGENSGLYKDEIVARGCTPNYLPEFIPIQVSKLQK